MWEDSIDGTSSLYDRGNSVCVDDSDNIYITGYIYNNAFKGFVAKYSPSGSLMYNSVVSSLQQGHHIRFESNYLYLYGITGTSGSPYHTQVLKLDKNSATQNSYTINDAYDNTIMQMIRENNQIYLLDSRGGGSSGYTSYAVHCLDSNLTFLWKNTHAGSAHLIPCNMVSYDTSLYVSSFEWNGAMSLLYSASLSRLSKTDGSIIAQVPVNANPVMSTRIFDLKADSIGNLSVAHLTTGNASGNYIKYLSHFDRNLQPLGLLALPDSMTYGDIYLYQKDDHTIYYSSAAWDSIGGNGDFLLYKLSDIAVGTSEFAGDKLLKVFPNPFAESATIISENKGEVRWRLTDMDGRLLDKGIVKTEQQLFFPHIQAGVYLLTCTDGRSTQTVKLVKHR